MMGRHVPDWFPDWRGQAALIIASGPSAAQADLAIARSCRAIAVNNSYALHPQADVLYACDARWWRAHVDARGFAGLKVTSDSIAALRYGLRRVRIERINKLCLDDDDFIGGGGNSGFQALNLAVKFGAEKIILIGFDMHLAGGVHWHGCHGGDLKNPQEATLARWRAVLDMVADQTREAGVRVINASPTSALSAYPKMSLEDALSC